LRYRAGKSRPGFAFPIAAVLPEITAERPQSLTGKNKAPQGGAYDNPQDSLRLQPKLEKAKKVISPAQGVQDPLNACQEHRRHRRLCALLGSPASSGIDFTDQLIFHFFALTEIF
jgi:hypothetical protein